MRLRRRADGNGDPDAASCAHLWRLRNVTLALPGPYVTEVCERCGAFRLDGPEAITGPPTSVADGAALHLESLARRTPPQPPA
jgi:hypothetical protein